MEIGGGPSTYESVRDNAYWTRVHWDTSLWPDVYSAKTYKAHLQDCIDNPTVGFLARRQYITKKPMNYSDFAWRNQKIMENDESVKKLKIELETILKRDFKKTRALRRYIINHDRVVLDEIKPGKGYKRLNKLRIILMRIF